MMAEKKTNGIVYCLTNPAMPDLVKIGLVRSDEPDSLKSRIYSLYAGNTSVPVLFELHYAVSVDDAFGAEKLLHKLFHKNRKNPKREFFSVDPEQVVHAMQLIAVGGGNEVIIGESESGDDASANISKEEIIASQRVHNELNKKRANFSFLKVGINPDETLVFSRDPEITAVVVDDKRVQFEGEIMSLSAAANKAFSMKGNDRGGFAGTWYWMYNGETLNEMRNRIASEKDSNSDESE